MRRSVVLVLGLILVVLVFPASNAWAQQMTIYGCVKTNNGQIRIVAAGEACLPSERSIQWSAGATVAAPPPVLTPGPLRVIDQNGAAVGVLVTSGIAAKQAGDLWVALPVTPMGFQSSAPTDVVGFYQTSDCSGDMYLPVDTGNLLRSGIVAPNSEAKLTLWYAGKPEVDRTTIQGYGHYSGGTWTCTAFTPGPWMPLFGKAGTLDLSTLQAPFKIVQ